MKRILIVEDDAALMLGLTSVIGDEGYEPHAARTGPEGLRLAKELRPDLIVLDIMLPGMSGFEICKRVRDERIPSKVLMLTAKDEEDDKIFGFELGADDYLTKPFSLRELLARIRAMLRRDDVPAATPPTPETGDRIAFGDVVVDFKRREVKRGGELQELTNREFLLLEYLIRHPGEVLTRERLLEENWGYGVHPTTRTVDNHVLRLRKHIEPDPENPIYLKTVRGGGYLFDLDGTHG
ncbi:MAG TPA: response regulator transcription factor [Verrucomicrobiae bacterium]|nr:response regulator transcription factor [Verrucomicrobiae bacterium]